MATKLRRQAGRSKPIHARSATWECLPHQEIWRKVQTAIDCGSRDHASQDAARSILRRRLPEMCREDHRRYTELEASRIVEILRVCRAEYQAEIDRQRCEPLTHVYWQAFRFGTMGYALGGLRDAVSDYLLHSRIKSSDWKLLFGIPDDYFAEGSPATSIPISPGELRSQIDGLLHESVFDNVAAGGPFGRDAQLEAARSVPGLAFLNGQEAMAAVIQRRQAVWDRCSTWTDSLAALFAVAQDELNRHFLALDQDSQRAEAAFLKLTPFRRIAWEHLKDNKREKGARLGRDKWIGLCRALDQRNIRPEEELTGKSREALIVARQKGSSVDTWEQCYLSKAMVTLQDGNSRRVSRQITHSIENAAKSAQDQLEKIRSSEGRE